jgi:hypothetical protein
MKAGHDVNVFTPECGELSVELNNEGILVADRLTDVFSPDIVHGHHTVETMMALLHFRFLPGIFVCHDRLSWHDTPPELSAIRKFVAVDHNCLERLLLESSIPRERTCVILNAVDTELYQPRHALPDVPRRAAVFSRCCTQSVIGGT